MDIMPLAKIVAKWARRVGIAAPEYEDGIKNPRRDWMTETLNAAQSWADAITEAIRIKSFETGVRAAGTSKWQDRAISLGVPRWGPGVRVAEPDFREGFEPYHRALEALVLPPRYPKRDERNKARALAVIDAMVRRWQEIHGK